MAELADGMGVRALERWTDHSGRNGGSRDPVSSGACVVIILMFLFSCISSVFFVNTAVQFWSHNFPTERREPEASVGKACAVVAWVGNVGIGKVVVWVESMVAPLGRRTFMAGLFGETGWSERSVSLEAMKCPVAPVSAFSVVVVGGADIILRLKYVLSTEL